MALSLSVNHIVSSDKTSTKITITPQVTYSSSIYFSDSPITNLDEITKSNGTSLTDGFFNLGANDFAVIKLKVPDHSYRDSSSQWVTLSRNNIFTSVNLIWFYENKLQQQSFSEHITGNKYLRTKVPSNYDKKTLYISLSGKYLRGKVALMSEASIYQQQKISSFKSGLYYGFGGLILLASLVIASLSRQQAFLSYAGLVGLTMLWIAAGERWLEMLIPSTASLSIFTANSLGLLFFILFASFSKQYLQLRVILPSSYKVLTLIQLFLCVIWVSYHLFFNQVPSLIYQSIYIITAILSMLVFLLSIFGAITAYKKGRRQSSYYLVAVTIIFLFASISMLSISNLLYLPISWHTVQLVSVIEISILTLGFIVWNHQKHAELRALTSEFDKLANEQKVTTSELNQLKSRMSENLLPPALTPHIAKVISLLPTTLFIKASGNYAEVHHVQNNQLKEMLVDCNLQTIQSVITDNQLIRCHKSYIVNLNNAFKLVRRNTADFDLILKNTKVPIGRSYLNIVRQLTADTRQSSTNSAKN